MDLLGKLLDYRNIHLAYERTKNHLINRELHSFQEQKAFELCIPVIYDEIRRILASPEKFKFQNVEILNKPKGEDFEKDREMRPLARISFYDAVIIQCVMNIVGELVAHILPSQNFGYRLVGKDSIYMYEHWRWGYAKFVEAEIEAISGNNPYEYVLELDIEEFYPSINHSILLNELTPYLKENSYIDGRDKKEGVILTWLEKILKIPQVDAFGGPIEYKGLGLPQGLLSSPILAMFYIRNCFKELESSLVLTEYFAYVDDFRFYCVTERQALEIKNEMTAFLESLKLTVNEEKTEVLPIEKAKVKEADIMGRASNIGRAMLNEVVLSAEGRKAIKANLNNLVYEMQELYDSLQEEGKPHGKLNLRIEKFALYRTIKLVETENEWARYALQLKESSMLTSNFAAMIHVIHNFATTTRQKQLFLEVLEEIILDTKYSKLTYIKYVALQYYFIWSPYEIKLTDSKIDNIIEEIINKESMPGTFLKGVLSKCHKDWTRIILDNIDDEKIGTDRELTTILLFADLKFNQGIPRLECPKEYNKQAIAKLEQDYQKLIYRMSHNNLIEEEYVKYLNSERLKNVEYIKFDIETKDCDEVIISIVNLHKNMVSLEEYSSHINDDSKLYILTQLFQWLSVQLNYKDLYNTKIPCSVINPKYIWIDQNIDSGEKNIVFLGNPFLNCEIFYRKVPDRMWKNEFIELFELLYNIDIRNTKMEMLSDGIQFWTFRIIQLLKAKSFKLEQFVEICLKILKNLELSDELIVGSEHFRLSHVMSHYIPTPYLHDKFIEITKFVESSWQNGSKECYFFTLHNHEHARFLVFIIHDFIEKTGFKIRINQREAFRLFTACFLHDMGMLSAPPETELFTKKFPLDEVNIIFSGLLESIQQAASTRETASTKKEEIRIEDNYANRKRFFMVAELVEQLQTTIIRDVHHEISKNEILWDYPHLPLTAAERRDIAMLCASHRMKRKEVDDLPDELYDARSPINLKLLAHMLRLADLCDVSYTRINKEVLERNEGRMDETSVFHWIKHMSVEDIELVCDNEDISQAKIKIHHSYIPWSYVGEKDLKGACKGWCKVKEGTSKLEDEKPIWELEEALKEEGSYIKYLNKDICNLACAFINRAYNWFYPEVVAINKYFQELEIDIELDLSIVIDEDKRKADFLFVENRNFKRSAQEFMVDYLLKP